MPASSLDLITRVTNGSRPLSTTLTAAKSGGVLSISCAALTGWTPVTGQHFVIYKKDTAGLKIAGTQTDWEGVVSGTSIGTMVLKAGTDNGYAIGDTVEAMPTAAWGDGMAQGMLAEHNASGTHAAITSPSAVFTGNVTAANFIQTGGASANGWTVGLATPNTITNNGNRSVSLVVNATDLTSSLSPGMRLRTTRTVAAPTQSASLNGTTQYFSNAAPAGMAFTTSWVEGAWIKATSYSTGVILSRQNGNGWELQMTSSGQILIVGYNTNGANFRAFTTYQSIPLNKWVHVVAQMDMGAGGGAGSPTTAYCMIDGVDVPGNVTSGGTSPVTIIQGGNLEIGSKNVGTSPFPGKIAQAFVTSAKLTQTQVRAIYSQGITTADTTTYNMISAYSLSGAGGLTDLNTTNNNTLTANGSAVTTNADAPFGGQAGGTISSTLDYGIIQAISFSTNTTITVSVPEGNTIPTSGGVSALAYSTQKSPYGFPLTDGILAFIPMLSNFTTAVTGSNVDILGLTTTLTLSSSRRLRFTLFNFYSGSTHAGGSYISLGISNGSSAMAQDLITSAGSSYGYNHDITWEQSFPAGTYTFKCVVYQSGTGTVTVTGSPSAPTYFKVEYTDTEY